MKLNNKRGSSAVFLMMILASMVMVTLAFVSAANKAAEASTIDGVLRLAGRSVLAEYCVELKQDYGLFGWYGTEETAESRLRFYLKENLQKYGRKTICAQVKDYSLINVDVFEEQIMDAAKLGLIGNFFKGEGELDSTKWTENDSSLKNQSITEQLPSHDVIEQGFKVENVLGRLFSLEKALTESKESLLTDSYACLMFRNYWDDLGESPVFFRNEIEYLLYGGFSDEGNQSRFLQDFKLLRAALNLIHIYGDPQKRAETLALAQTINPAAAPAIQAVLCSLWAAAEAENDVKLFRQGEPVKLIKGPENWALTLTGAIDGIGGSEGVRPVVVGGESYEDYLRLFLFFQDRETKLLRMMDLIQINMKLRYQEDFLMRNCYGGLSYFVECEGKSYEYDQEY